MFCYLATLKSIVIMASPRNKRSMETILTFDNRDTQSQWSMVWSTTHLAEMDDMSAQDARRRMRGRRRLRMGSLALSALMTMHCRLPSAALTNEIFFFLAYLVVAVATLANPVRHFEVYLGQWSISGPGRAFRMIPVLDGIGMAMCINAVLRAILCCTMASIAASYVYYSVSDATLPSTYCRDFDSEIYDPVKEGLKSLRCRFGPAKVKNVIEDYHKPVGLNLNYKLRWKNGSFTRRAAFSKLGAHAFPSEIKVCNETYAGKYPPMYTTPAYNYFYVELVHYRDTEKFFGNFNIPLGVTIIVAWLIIWIFMIMEKITYSRLIYNNIHPWFVLVPWIWSTVLVAQCAYNLSISQTLDRLFKIGTNRDSVAVLADACELALYIHSIGVGTELIHGKALHNYASGHIDPLLGSENVWHSGIVLMLALVHACGAAMCALVDFKHFNPLHQYQYMKESTLWIMPMYSNCTSMGEYSHFVTTLIFGGLVFSYMAVALVNLKTALHTIFEYRVKLVFKEQYVVACLILFCMALSMLHATNGGVALLESVDAIMTSISMTFVAFLEVVCLIYMYRGHDFRSDLNVANEDNVCPSRIGIQWSMFPFIALAALGTKISVLITAEMPSKFMMLGTIPLAAVVLSLTLRGVKNACTFMRNSAALARPPST